uniref:PlsC domain-containing protein n=1 Tax=Strongyloides venezuelensis TaxID=75913 RepID=A0A0K0FN91_STRVS
MIFFQGSFLGVVFDYLLLIFICYIIQVITIAANINFSYLNELYFYIIDCIHDFLEADCPQTNFYIDPEKFTNIIDTRRYFKLICSKKEERETFLNNLVLKEDREKNHFVFDIGTNLLISGVEAVIEDDVVTLLEHHPEYQRFQSPFNPDNLKGSLQKIIAYSIIIYKFAFLIPIRVLFIMTAVFSFIVSWVYGNYRKLTPFELKWVGKFGCSLMLASCGGYARFHNRENKPFAPGFIAANHMSFTDVFPMYIDVDLDDKNVLQVTGQKGRGIIKIYQQIVSSILPTHWLNRHMTSERKRFLEKILREAKTQALILIFPEGYCSNNRSVLQFRKSIFVDNVNIYPVVLKQNSKYNDIFWYEDIFKQFMLRQLTSLGVIYDVYYLPKVTKQANENEAGFAYRVSEIISSKLGTTPSLWGGEHIYKKENKEKMKNEIRRVILFGCKSKFNLI